MKDTNPARPSNRIHSVLAELFESQETSQWPVGEIAQLKAQVQAIIDYLDERWERSQRKSEHQNKKEVYASIDTLLQMLSNAGVDLTLHGKPVTKEEVRAHLGVREADPYHLHRLCIYFGPDPDGPNYGWKSMGLDRVTYCERSVFTWCNRLTLSNEVVLMDIRAVEKYRLARQHNANLVPLCEACLKAANPETKP